MNQTQDTSWGVCVCLLWKGSSIDSGFNRSIIIIKKIVDEENDNDKIKLDIRTTTYIQQQQLWWRFFGDVKLIIIIMITKTIYYDLNRNDNSQQPKKIKQQTSKIRIKAKKERNNNDDVIHKHKSIQRENKFKNFVGIIFLFCFSYRFDIYISIFFSL